jgi:hypothetical protein
MFHDRYVKQGFVTVLVVSDACCGVAIPSVTIVPSGGLKNHVDPTLMCTKNIFGEERATQFTSIIPPALASRFHMTAEIIYIL